MPLQRLWAFGLVLSCFSASFAQADNVKYLPNAEGALAQYLSDIRSARSSIDITFYIWDPCSVVARVLVRELEKKKKENPSLPVRLLLDASLHSDKGRSEITATLAKRGIDVRFYNFTSDFRKNVRTHIKFINVDNDRVISGGRNIADDYFSLSPIMNWIDREARVEGASARKAGSAFQQLWNDRLTKREPRKASPAEIKASEETCLKADSKVLEVERHLNENMESILARSPTFRCPTVRVAVDNPDFMEAMPGSLDGGTEEFLSGERLAHKVATKEIMSVVSEAKHNLFFENYTYIPSAAIFRQLEKFRHKRLPITMITNDASDESQGIMHGPASYYQNRHNVGSQQIVKIPKGHYVQDNWAMTPGNPTYQIHSKVLTADGKDAVVSSFNLDPRSYHTNLESAIVVRNCPAFAKHVTETSEATYERARKILMNPQVRYCLDQRESAHSDKLNDFLGWLVHELL